VVGDFRAEYEYTRVFLACESGGNTEQSNGDAARNLLRVAASGQRGSSWRLARRVVTAKTGCRRRRRRRGAKVRVRERG